MHHPQVRISEANARLMAQMATGSTPRLDLAIDSEVARQHRERPAIIQAAKTAEQKVAALKEQFKAALLNVATSRKQIYEIIIELKEHFHEYGFNNAAVAVETVCQRTKRWANMFCADIEAEAEISQVGNTFPTSPDKDAEDKEETLNTVANLPEVEPPKDGAGAVIPQQLILLWDRKDEVTELLTQAAHLRKKFEDLQTDKDPLFLPLKSSGNVQTFMTSMGQIHYHLRECLPEVVCPFCKAKDKKCTHCLGRGMISKVRYNRDWVKTADERAKVDAVMK